MNNQLILKLIKYNNGKVPDIVYDNILLDKNVASELSKSFVKIINSENLTSNNHLRLSVIQNLRKLCQTEPENHLKINDDVIELLKESYKKALEQPTLDNQDFINQKLNNFISNYVNDLRIRKEDSIKNAEVIIALMNLNTNYIIEDIDILNEIDWKSEKSTNIIQQIWNQKSFTTIPCEVINNIAKLMKRNIEQEVLNIISEQLSTKTEKLSITSSCILDRLIVKSSISCICFQTCVEILNHILIKSSFDCRIRNFITDFVTQIRNKSNNFLQLYPLHLQSLVLLLDVNEFDMLQPGMKEYIENTINIMHNVSSVNFLIMLLSHFPVWFDHYFNKYGT